MPKRSNLIAQAAASFDARNNNHSFLKNQADEEPWAEIARFNQLLDIKIKLDEASEQKRKADIQKAYLDQQVRVKVDKVNEAKREKT